MRWEKFEYAMNAIYYCRLLQIGKFQNRIDIFVTFILLRITKNLFPNVYQGIRKRAIPPVYDITANDKNGCLNYLGEFDLYTTFSMYLIGILFIIQALLYFFCGYFVLSSYIIVIIPFVMTSYLLNRSVFSKDKYLGYFKIFKSEEDEWLKKWIRNTTLYMCGSFVSLILGIAIIWSLVVLYDKVLVHK